MNVVNVPHELLEQHIKELDEWNDAVGKIVGKPEAHRWPNLEALRALLVVGGQRVAGNERMRQTEPKVPRT